MDIEDEDAIEAGICPGCGNDTNKCTGDADNCVDQNGWLESIDYGEG